MRDPPKSRVALVTGASRGIGRATAERLSRTGHRVVGVARRRPADGFPGRFLEVDLGDAEAAESAFRQLAGEEPFDMLVNNAGMVSATPLEAISPADLARTLDINLRPALQAVQALLPGMRARQWGSIVNVSSLTVLGARNRLSYAGAKAALISFTRNWALELAADRITVNCVAPGPTDTALFRENNPVGSLAEQRLVSSAPLGRIATPEEIAAAITFFVSDEAAIITGQTLFVDGGLSIGRSLL